MFQDPSGLDVAASMSTGSSVSQCPEVANDDDCLTSLSWLQNLNMSMTRLGAPTPPASPDQPINSIPSTAPSTGTPLPPFSSCLPSSSHSDNLYATYSLDKSSLNSPHIFVASSSASSSSPSSSASSSSSSSCALISKNGHLARGDDGSCSKNKIRSTRKRINVKCNTSNSSTSPSSSCSSSCNATSTSDSFANKHTSCRESKLCISPDELVAYKLDGSKKPPFSYATLIGMAIKANNNKMTLSSIYNWIRENFLYYQNADPSWQNSIRHNLSLNKCFMKIPRTKEEPGKGGFWRLDPNYAERLVDGVFRKRRINHRQINCMIDAKHTSSDGIDGNLNDLSTGQVAIVSAIVSAPRKRRRKEKSTVSVINSTSNSRTRCGLTNSITVITSAPSLAQQDSQLVLSSSSSSNINVINSPSYGQYNYLSSNQVNEINLNRENVLRIDNCLTRSNLTNSQETPPSSPDSYSTALNVAQCETIELVNAVNSIDVTSHPSVSSASYTSYPMNGYVDEMCIPSNASTSNSDMCWNTILTDHDLEFVNPINYSCQVVQHESTGGTCSCDECIVGTLMTNYIA